MRHLNRGIETRSRGGSRAESDLRDLRRLEKPHRRTPESRAAAHVERRAPARVLAGDIARRETDERGERPDLAAVRMPGELQVDAMLRGLVEHVRVVSEQHDRPLP